MRYKIVPSKKFKRELKFVVKKGYDISLLNLVVERLANGNILPEKYHDHT